MKRQDFLVYLLLGGCAMGFVMGIALHTYADHIGEKYRDALPTTQLQPYETHTFQWIAGFALVGVVMAGIGALGLVWTEFWPWFSNRFGGKV